MGDSSLTVSPGKDGERVVNCWNCEGPLTPTHQCGEVNFGDFNYSHDGKYCDERGVRYLTRSDIILTVMHLTLQIAAQSAQNVLTKDMLPSGGKNNHPCELISPS